MNSLMNYALKNADHVIFKEFDESTQEIQISNNKLDAGESSEKTRYAVKLWIKNKQGLVSGNELSKSLIDKAVAIAKANNPEEYFFGLPEKATPSKLFSIDKKISQLTPDDLVCEAKKLIEQTNKVILSQGSVSSSISELRTLTSNGIDCTDKFTTYSVVAAVTAKKAGKVSSVWEEKTEPHFFSLGMEKLQNKALSYLDAKKLKIKLPVILTPECLSELLNYTLLDSFNLKNVEKKRSILSGKLNKRCFDKNLSIIDDATKQDGLASYRTDFEGTLGQKTNIVKDGILKNFISDYNTAKQNKLSSTGNATERGIGFSNILLKAPQQDIKKAVVVETVLGAHTCDSVTTNFSVKVDNAYILEHKKRTPVKAFMISGNMLEVLNNILSMSKKQRQQSSIYSGALASTKINVVLQ